VLESSGNANAIRDDSLRANLLDYYATVERIAFAEQEMNSLVREVTLRYQTDTTRGFFPPYLRAPLLAWQPSELGEYPEEALAFQAAYLQLLSDSVTLALLRSGRNQPLLKEYEHLLTLGRALLVQIESHRAGAPAPPDEHAIFHPTSGDGPPRVFVQGRFEAHSLGLFNAPVGAQLDSSTDVMRLEQDHLRISYPGGDPWAFLYAAAGPLEVSVRKPFLDYSRFSRIRLELKQESGCDDLHLVLKDARDADDGSQANVRLGLSNQWETYEYELARFTDADLSELNVVTGFLMTEAPCDFSIRDVSFL
jgi:hypothetical protein